MSAQGLKANIMLQIRQYLQNKDSARYTSTETSLDLCCIKFFILFIFSLLKANIKSDKIVNLNQILGTLKLILIYKRLCPSVCHVMSCHNFSSAWAVTLI